MKIWLLIIMVLTAIQPISALNEDFFDKESKFKNGKWVKFAIRETGVYEIPYSKLRELGFSTPENVGIVGRSDRSLPENFVNKSGVELYTEDLPEVSVTHESDKLIFYVEGVEGLKVKKNGNGALAPAYFFDSEGFPVYSDKIWYFLTDTGQKLMPLEESEEDLDAEIVSDGYTFSFIGERARHIPSESGRDYYWKQFLTDGNTFELALPEYIGGTRFYLTGKIIGESLQSSGDSSDKFEVKCGTSSTSCSLNTYGMLGQTTFSFQTSAYIDRPEIVINSPAINSKRFSALQYAVATYYKDLNKLSQNVSSHHFLFGQLKDGKKAKLSIPDDRWRILDITDKSNIRGVTLSGKDPGNVVIPWAQTPPEIILYNPSAKLKEPEIFREVRPTDLRERLNRDADMLLVTVAPLLPQAKRLAEVHKSTDGVRVVIATLPEIYNEFGGGMPDPMAIRAAVKMLSMAEGGSLKNLLLFGPYNGNPCRAGAIEPLNADGTSIPVDPDFPESEMNLIPPFVPDRQMSIETGSEIFNEFYVLPDDYLASKAFFSYKTALGVGILPVRTYREADRMVDKIERYLTDNTIAYRAPRLFFISDEDGVSSPVKNTRLSMDAAESTFPNRLIQEPFLKDHYPAIEYQRLFYNYLKTDPAIITYFGHGSPYQMSNNFITRGSLLQMNNPGLPFMLFMGCEFSAPDRGVRGIAEEMILGLDKGLIGGLVSVRETDRQSTEDICKELFKALGTDNDKNPRYNQISIGEAWSQARGRVSRSDIGKFVLMCDPSLKLPLPVLDIKVSSVSQKEEPGFTLISGEIMDADGEKVKDYNGEVIVRLLEKPRHIAVKSDAYSDKRDIPFTFRDHTLQIRKSDVKGGEFSIMIPDLKSLASTDSLYFSLSACDFKSRETAATLFNCINNPIAWNEIIEDNEAPTVDLIYIEEKCLAELKVSDNVAVSPPYSAFDNNLNLTLDGKTLENIYLTPSELLPENNGYCKQIMLPIMTDGPHFFVVKVTDDSGNVTEQEIPVMTGKKDEKIEFSLSSDLLRDEVELLLPPSSGLTLYVQSLETRITGTFKLPESGNILWKGTLDDGTVLPTGVYRLHVKELGGNYSSPVLLKVIREPSVQ